MKTSIGDFLAILRKSKGLTQQEVADHLGVSNKTISSWETGTSCPDISMLPAIAELFEVSCDELLRGERIPSSERVEKSEEKREKSLSHILAAYRNNATIISWICIGLYIVAMIAALLIGCAAFESLIGFFVGLLFIVGGVFLCLIQNHYLRFQLAQNEFESEAIDTFVRFLSRRQTLTLVLAAAAFGFIVPHVTVPVHSGLRVAYAFGFGVLGGACGAGLACLISFVVKTAKKSYRTDREKFFWTLKNGGIPYSVLAVVGTAAILVGLTIFAKNAEVSVPISTDYANSYFALRQSMSEKNAELFTDHPNTLYETTALETTLDEAQLNAAITESMRPREILIGKASYYFVNFPSEYEASYHIVHVDGGAYVEVEVVTIRLENGEIFSTPVLNRAFQGGINDLECVPLIQASPDDISTFEFVLHTDPPLYESVTTQSNSISLVSILAAVALLLLIYTAIYLPRRKKFLKSRAPFPAE